MKKGKKNTKASEPPVSYNRTINIFHSFEEQEMYDAKQMASLSSTEILLQLRQLINLAYGMHGYDPNKLPKQHSIKNIKYID